MKRTKAIICACVAVLSVGCVNHHSNTQNATQATQMTPTAILDRFINSAIASTPNYMNNDVTRSMLADTLKSRVNQYQGGKMPFLSELPMEYEMCLPYNQYSAFAGKYVVKFSYCNNAPERHITFQVFTRMDKEQVANLVDHAKYSIDGTFLFFPDNTQSHWFELPSGRGFTDNPKIHATIEFDNTQTPFINLGSFIMDDVSFTPAK